MDVDSILDGLAVELGVRPDFRNRDKFSFNLVESMVLARYEDMWSNLRQGNLFAALEDAGTIYHANGLDYLDDEQRKYVEVLGKPRHHYTPQDIKVDVDMTDSLGDRIVDSASMGIETVSKAYDMFRSGISALYSKARSVTSDSRYEARLERAGYYNDSVDAEGNVINPRECKSDLGDYL